jgi:hypothetical protein
MHLRKHISFDCPWWLIQTGKLRNEHLAGHFSEAAANSQKQMTPLIA